MNRSNDVVARILLDINAVTIRPDKPFKYSSGLLSPVYSDMRLLISHPAERRKITELLSEKIESLGHVDIIAGTATGAIPHAAWIADMLEKPMVYIRGKAKGHGKQNQVEGLTREGQRAVVVEDLISTGMSSIDSVNALRELGVKSDFVVSIFNYTMSSATENFRSRKINLVSLTTFPDVVKMASNEGVMKKADENIVLDWLSDPSGWASRHNFHS